MMYLEHFGLREPPFGITPHTEFFFAGANRGATLEALIYAITHDEGIIKVSGEVGSGKTMLCRMLLERLPKHVTTVYLANPLLPRGEILYAISEELGAPLPDGRSHQLLRSMQERLIDIHASGRRVVVMVDEAHAMPTETLEEIRLLTNLETDRHKLLHVVLFGQPELDARLSDVSMRQLKERITHNFSLEPLLQTDIGPYMMYRMRAAGYRGPDLFSPGAIRLIAGASEGLTRRINILADKSLLAAFSESRHHIDRKQAKAAIADAKFHPLPSRWPSFVRWSTGLSAMIAIGIAGFLAARMISGLQPPPLVDTPVPPATITSPPALTPPVSPDAIILRPAEAPPALPQVAEPRESAPDRDEATVSLAERISATEEWVRSTPPDHYFIQLLSVDASYEQDVERYVDKITKELGAQQIRVYRSALSGKDRIGVIYGDFASRKIALGELSRIAQTPGIGNPYLRTVEKLR